MTGWSLAFWRYGNSGLERVRASAFYRRVADGVSDLAQRAAAAGCEVRERIGLRPGSRAALWTTATLKVIAIVLVCLYVGVAALLYFTQRSMMYFPETMRTPPTQANLPEAKEVTLKTSDGERIIAWQAEPRDNKPVILYFHGNGGSLRYRADRFHKLIMSGLGLVAVEYRGFGGSTGSPTEAGLIADAEAGYDFAAARYPAQRIVLWGESLGTGPAIVLAAEKSVGRVILEAPFTSAAAVAATTYWFLPVRLLMKDQFRSDERIAKITAPVLILHGAQDEIVPYAMGERMFDLTKARKHIVRFLDGGHSDLDRNGALHAVGRFLAGDLD